MVAATKAGTLDGASREMMFSGLNLSQLGVLFHMDHRVLVQKLHGVEPSAKRNGYAIYEVHKVAPYLVRPMYDIETYIKKMNHNDLPNELKKEFWNALKARQDYELRAGHLWPTSKVIEHAGELLKLVKMSAQLATDNLERNTELTDRQRDGINEILRSMLEDLQSKIAENFKEPEEDGRRSSYDDQEI